MGAEREGGRGEKKGRERSNQREKDQGVGSKEDGWEREEREGEGRKTDLERGGWVGGDTYTPAGKTDREMGLGQMCLASLG